MTAARKWTRRRWWIIAGLVLFHIVIIGGYIYFTSSSFLRPRVERALNERLNARTSAEGIDFGLLAGTSIDRLTLLTDARGGEGSPSKVAVDNVHVEHDLWQLLGGNYVAQSVRVGRLEAAITPSFREWVEGVQRQAPPGPGAPLPRIDIRRGEIRYEDPSLPQPVRINDLSVLLAEQQPGRLSGVVSFRLGGNRVRLSLSAVPGQGYGDMEISIHGFDLQNLPLLQRSVGWFEPSRLSMNGALTGSVSMPIGSGSMPPFSGEFTLSDTVMGYRGWPLDITDLSGQISLTRSGISVSNLKATLGEGRVTVTTARARLQDGGLASVSMRGTARNLDLETLTHKSLPWSDVTRGEWGRLYSGSADADFSMQWSPGAEPSYQASLTLRDGSLALARLDRTFDDISVQASVDSTGRIDIEECRAPVAGGEVNASGSLRVEEGRIRQPRLTLELTNVGVQPDLIGRVVPRLEGRLRQAGLVEPRVDGQVRIKPDETSCDLEVRADAVEPAAVRYRLTGFSTQVLWSSADGTVRLEHIEARQDGGRLEGNLSVELAENPVLNINLAGRSLPLNDRLLDVLPPDVRGRVRQWSPRGRFDIEVRARDFTVPDRVSEEALKKLAVSVQLRNLSFSRWGLSPLAQDIYGHLSLREGGLKVTEVNGSVLDTGFRVNGSIPLLNPERSVSLRIETDTVDLDPEWLRSIPHPAARRAAELDLKGQCTVRAEVNGTLGGSKPLKVVGNTIIHSLELRPKSVPVWLSGTSRLELTHRREGPTALSGDIRLHEAGSGDLVLDRMSAQFDYSDQLLQVPRVDLSAYGGKVVAENTRADLRTGQWRTAVDYSHVDLESLMGGFGIQGKEAPGGVLRGTLEVAGRGLNPETLQGKGELRIDRGRLYRFPVLLSVFSVLDLGLPNQDPVSDAYGEYRLEPGKLTIENLVFSGGGGMPVHITGDVQLEEGVKFKNQGLNLLVTVTKRRGLLDAIPVIGFIKHYTIDLLRQFIMQARVTGTFADYDVSTIADPVTKPVQAIWNLLPKLNPLSGEGEEPPVAPAVEPEEGSAASESR